MGRKSREKRERRENVSFHITIGASMVQESNDDIASQTLHQIRLVKAALLYADKVTLCSPIIHALLAYERMGRFSVRQQAELLRLIAPTIATINNDPQLLENFLIFLENILGEKQLPKSLCSIRHELENQFRQTFQGMRQGAEEAAKSFNLDQLALLIRTGRVEVQNLGEHLSDVEIVAGSVQSAAHIQQLIQSGVTQGKPLPYNRESSKNALMDDFLEQLTKAVNSPKTYPLFDDLTGNLVQLGIKEGIIETTQVQINRAKHVSLAASLIERLPLFDEATLDELLDIQKELSKPLIRFRQAMMSFSSDVASAPWENDFSIEAENVFRLQIEPALLEIEDSIESNNYLYEILHRAVEKPFSIVGTSALGLALSQTNFLGEVAAKSLGIGASAAMMFGGAWMDYIKEKSEIEKNQLFFYYRTAKNLQARSNAL